MTTAPPEAGELASLLGVPALTVTPAPVVDLADPRIRRAILPEPTGPVGSALADPEGLASAAATLGLAADLDQARWHAARALLTDPGSPPLLLPGNADSLLELPEAPVPGAATVLIDARQLVERPGHLLRLVEHARGLGWSIGVRSVGTDPAVLPLLAVLAPTVLCLDSALLRRRPDRAVAQTMMAATLAREDTDALVVCPGVHTDADRRAALALGATAATGRFHTGSPRLDRPHRPLPPVTTVRPTAAGAYRLATTGSDVAVADKRLLVAISKHLEALSFDSSVRPLLIGSFQHVRQYTPATARRWSNWATGSALTVALGDGMPPAPSPGVRGVALDPADPVCQEWSVVVVAGQLSCALTARDLGDDGPDPERRFEYVLTHRRDVVLEIARTLLRRVPADLTP